MVFEQASQGIDHEVVVGTDYSFCVVLWCAHYQERFEVGWVVIVDKGASVPHF